MNKSKNEISKSQIWYDYVRETKRGTYIQSPTEKEGYVRRTIGICKCEYGYIVSVAIPREDELTVKAGRAIVYSKMNNLIQDCSEIPPNVKGITIVPSDYVDLLWNDPVVVNSLYGPVAQDKVINALKELKGD